MLEAARRYLAAGMHPVPCEPGGKKPLVRWQEYQARAPTTAELDGWWGEQWPDANIALVVGRGIVVVDLDGPGAAALLRDAGLVMPEAAPRVRTGRGEHVYLRLPAGRTARNRAGFLASTSGEKSQVDLRADGGYVLAPPSLHPNGRRYEWLSPLVPLAAIPLVPDSLLNWKPAAKEAPPSGEGGWVAVALRGVGEGQRNDTAARLAGYFLAKGHPEDVVVALLESFATRCRPALPVTDVRQVVASIARAEARKPREDAPGTHEDAPGGASEARRGPVHISEAIRRALDEIQNPRQGIPTPFLDLGRCIIGGFQPGELIYLGARPGIGKTAFALEVARAAAKGGKRVLVISREMLAAALARRMISQEGLLRATDLKLGRIDMGRACEVGESLSGLPVWITDSARSLVEVRADLEAVTGGVDLLIVDYLQLVQAPREIRDRRLQVEHVSQGLKGLALECEIPVLCLSSLSRPPTGTNPEPTLASLRESGELEHDADIVLFLHRPSKSDPSTLCIVAKNRDGGTGVSQLVFREDYVSFYERGRDE